MSEHVAVVTWERRGAVFTDNAYSREHRWAFDGGVEVVASASPAVVRPPLSTEAAVDPEEAFVAALSSCHMLWFLSIAARRGLVVDSYRDEAFGLMGRNPDGKLAIIRTTLRPAVTFGGDTPPDAAEVASIHHEAHEACFIANSVRTEVRCEPVAP